MQERRQLPPSTLHKGLSLARPGETRRGEVWFSPGRRWLRQQGPEGGGGRQRGRLIGAPSLRIIDVYVGEDKLGERA